MRSADVVIAGAGLVGLACALECSRRGLRPLVLERGEPGREASWAAAGMLAARDPANPPALQALADRSIALYPEFLSSLTGVPFETEWTLEAVHGQDMPAPFAPAELTGDNFHALAEWSLNPRTLFAGVHAAAGAAGFPVRAASTVTSWASTGSGVMVRTERETFTAGAFLDCTGAWSEAPVVPSKGQMLRVHAPGALAVQGRGNVVVRTQDIYLVPRLDGSVVIGATVEHAGFDKTVHAADLHALRARAAAPVPCMVQAPEIEHWAGLRPDTPDHLPLLGATGERSFVAAGHFRNGILLAPATARVMAQLLLGEEPEVDLAPFDPARFAQNAPTASPRAHDIRADVVTTEQRFRYNRTL